MKRNHHLPSVVLLVLLLNLAHCGNTGKGRGTTLGISVEVPSVHTALSGDLYIRIYSSSFLPLSVQLSRLEGTTAQLLKTFPVYPEASALKRNVTFVKVECGYFSRGGVYFLQIRKQSIGSNTTSTTSEEMITRKLDVRWPIPRLSVNPEHFQTYPQKPVTASLEFPEVMCPPKENSVASAIPEFWLELHFCGHSLLTCEGGVVNKSAQILYSEQVRGLPGHRIVPLSCQLFGLAGHYALFLKPTGSGSLLPRTTVYIKVEWSKEFVFNVNARSIFPCDSYHGIIVLFQYPSCTLATGDRVRLFAKYRSNVSSLNPPTKLEYVAEQRVVKDQYSLRFECDMFSERYVEYCFVYVSQAISGAVSDVRENCVPTLPVSDKEIGGWGPWSPWTPCSSTCIGGIRTRYRFCDSPPPRYGAKFCEGPRVETERCENVVNHGPSPSWDCVYGDAFPDGDVSEVPEVASEVGPYCRCGCVIHIGRARPKRLIAASAQSCPGRTFWLVQADEDSAVLFRVEQFRAPCGKQWLRVRDGSSSGSRLLADLRGDPADAPAEVNATGPALLLEYYAEETTVAGRPCGGGFLAHARQINLNKTRLSGVPVAQSVGVIPTVILKLTAVHIAAIFFLSGLIVATSLLGAQYLFRYRKYQKARADDQDSFVESSGSSNSLPITTTRATSNTTLFSEVASLRVKSMNIIKHGRKHSRLRESVDSMEFKERTLEPEVTLAKEEESSLSASTATLTAPVEDHAKGDVQTTPNIKTSPRRTNVRSSSRASSLDKDETTEKHKEDRERTGSTVTLTNVSNEDRKTPTCSKSDPGCYSSGSSMISTATIRSTNIKATKDKRNREKVLAGPAGSDFSIAGPDLEMDYYDYNVVNAGAAPGSYLGMDPAFLVWIPPLDESGEILPEENEEEITPRIYIDPGSNKESPEKERLLPKGLEPEQDEDISPSRLRSKDLRSFGVTEDNRYLSESEPLMDNRTNNGVVFQMHEFPKKLKLSRSTRDDLEKETEVEKSPITDENVLNEIKFADDEDEADFTETRCNIDGSYQDSNILSST